MRGVVVAILFAFFLAVHLLVGAASVDPVAEEAKTWVGPEYDTSIDRVLDTYFKWMPMIFVGGGIYFAIRWYMSGERFTGGRPPI